MSSPRLKPEEKFLFIAMYRAVRGSTTDHPSENRIAKYYPKELKNDHYLLKRVRSKAYKSLRGKVLIIKHLTEGKTTWQFSKEGLNVAIQVFEEYLKELEENI